MAKAKQADLEKIEDILSNPILAAVKNIWNSAFLFDLETSEYEVYFAPEYYNKLATQFKTPAQYFEAFASIMSSQFQNRVSDFLDFSTMEDRLKGKPYISTEARTEKLGWIRIFLIPLNPVSRKKIKKILFATQSINEEVQKQADIQNRGIEYLRIMANLSAEYEDVYLVDLDNDTFETMAFSNIIQYENNDIVMHTKYSSQHDEYINNFVLPEYRKPVLEAVKLENLREYFKTKKDLFVRYKVYAGPNGQTNYEIHMVKVDHMSGNFMVMGFRCIDEIIAREAEIQRQLKQSPAKKEHLLSQLTRLLYGFNLSIDMESGTFTLIEGSGMEKTVEYLKTQTSYQKIQKNAMRTLHPSYRELFMVLTDLEILRNRKEMPGIIGSLRYQVIQEEEQKYEWHEINVFSGIDENERWVVNILCRDITESHERHKRHERELRVASEKNLILSELTRMLFSYNISVNLNTGKYNVIIGNDENSLYSFVKETDDYVSTLERKAGYVLPEYRKDYLTLLNLDSLRVRRNIAGFIGSLEYATNSGNGIEWREINVFITIDEFGNSFANILGKDITEVHKQKERKILEQQAAIAHDQLLSGITKMIYGLNATVNLVSWKYSLIVGTGMEPVVEIISKTDDYIITLAKVKNLIVKEYLDDFENLFGIDSLLSVKNSVGFIGSVITAAYRENKIRWQETSLFMGKNESGEPVANILSRDITEKHEQQERRERELKASMAKDQLLSGVTKLLYGYNLTVDLQTMEANLIEGSPKMKSAINFFDDCKNYYQLYEKALSIVDKEDEAKLKEFLSPEKLLTHTGKSGFINTIEIRCKLYGLLFWEEVNIFAGFNEKGESIINMLGRNTSEAHEKEETERRLSIEKATNEAKSQFLSKISHDIRTPINGIMGMLTIARNYSHDKERVDECFKKIDISSNYLLELIDDVLDLGKLESGKMVLSSEPIDIKESLEQLSTIIISMAKDLGIQLIQNKPEIQHRYVLGSSLHIRRILINIITNAIKYNKKDGSVSLSLKEIKSDSEYATYQFIISDTGIGMSEEFQATMFDSFVQERRKNVDKYRSSGLGLAIVKHLVDLMNGTINVKSKIGEGSEFIIELPLKIDRNPKPKKKNEKIEINLKGMKILLVEDIEINMEIARILLTDAGCNVVTAENGKIAVDLFSKSKPNEFDVILMDVMMPVMDGYQATSAIRALKRSDSDVPIIAMTANAFADDIQKCLSSGMNGHVAKPFKIENLVAELVKYKSAE